MKKLLTILFLFVFTGSIMSLPVVSIKTLEVKAGESFKITINHPFKDMKTDLFLIDKKLISFNKKDYLKTLGKDVFYFESLMPGETIIGIKVINKNGKIIDEYRFKIIIKDNLADEIKKIEKFNNDPEDYQFYSQIDIRDNTETPFKKKNMKQLMRIASVEEREQYELAEEIFKRGYYEKSITEFNKLLYRFPKGTLSELVSLRIGDAYYSSGMFKYLEAKEQKKARNKAEAIANFTDAVNYFKKAKLQYKRVEAIFSSGEFLDRVQYFTAASQNMFAKSQFEIDDYNLSIKQEVPLVNFEDAIVEYLRVIINYNSSIYCDNARLEIGLYYKNLADYLLSRETPQSKVLDYYKRAMAEFDGILKNYPGSDGAGYAYYNKAIIFDRILIMRNFKKAVENYEQLYNNYKDYPLDENLRKLALSVKERMDIIKKEYL